MRTHLEAFAFAGLLSAGIISLLNNGFDIHNIRDVADGIVASSAVGTGLVLGFTGTGNGRGE